jgi:uracil-DNA glycosylase
LFVLYNQAGSHSHIGWQVFTDEIIRAISTYRENVVFILLGAHAQSKKQLINSRKHCILESAHPSPLSAYTGFLIANPFPKPMPI